MMKLSFFRALIIDRLDSLATRDQTARSQAVSVELDQTRVGRLSRMDALQMAHMHADSDRRRQQEILALKSALRRIEEGEYGRCMECDEWIADKRLEIDPTALYCIQCAQKKESGH